MSRELTTQERMKYASMFGLQIYRENPGMSIGESFVAGLRRADEVKIVTREELQLESEAQLRDYLVELRSDPAAHGLLMDEFSVEGQADAAPGAGIVIVDKYESLVAKIIAAQED